MRTYYYRKYHESELLQKYKGKRVFLLGNGPSLADMKLDRLQNEYICTVNMGFRAIGSLIDHTDFHIIGDKNRYLRFGHEIEHFFETHKKPELRFLEWHSRSAYRRNKGNCNTIFFQVRCTSITDDCQPLHFSQGVCRSSTIVVLAAQLLYQMGFSKIYIIGCDLDYTQEKPYFYKSGSLDEVHEADQRVIARRQELEHANSEFSALRTFLENQKCRIFNAGLGGNLMALPRIEFDTLFSDGN